MAGTVCGPTADRNGGCRGRDGGVHLASRRFKIGGDFGNVFFCLLSLGDVASEFRKITCVVSAPSSGSGTGDYVCVFFVCFVVSELCVSF